MGAELALIPTVMLFCPLHPPAARMAAALTTTSAFLTFFHVKVTVFNYKPPNGKIAEYIYL
jgi:hypothetical protein